jgi:hypothetical protein
MANNYLFKIKIQFQFVVSICAPIQFVPRYSLWPIQFVPRYHLLPDTICARYHLCPTQFVSDTVCADTVCADTICADTICSRYNLCRYNLYMNHFKLFTIFYGLQKIIKIV